MKIKDLNFLSTRPEEFWKEAKLPTSVATVHAEMAYLFKKDKAYQEALKNIETLLADGVGLKVGLIILGKNATKCSGVDLINSLNSKESVFLWGAKEETVKNAAENLKEKGLNIVGYEKGFDFDEDKVFENIKKSGAKIVFVGMGGTARQIELVGKIYKELNITAVTVGGAFEVLSGNFKRAPFIFQKIGLEWLFRTIQNPKRIKRLPFLFGFVLEVLKERLSK